VHVVARSRPAVSTTFLRTGWLLGIFALWWLVGWSRIDQVPAAASEPALRVALPWVLAGVRIIGATIEALFYWVWWRSAGQAFSFTSALPWFATLTIVDAWAGALRSIATETAEPWTTVIAVLAGVAVRLEPGATPVPGLAAAFGDVGVLALGRVLGAAAIQAHETGRRLRGPLLLTVVVWLLVKLITWWSYDLMRGMSPS
jgi:hypothetical protein